MPSKTGRRLRTFHLARLVIYVVLTPIAMMTELGALVKFVTFLSLVALIEGCFAAYTSGRAEVAIETRDED